jgi:SpoVK/Ycf46/Vps4 family AAA+-type ATPase
MKRVVNTILQLFDYLPQSSIVIAATNQKDMLDEALLRRFDLNIRFDLPDEKQIKELISLILKNGQFKFDKQRNITAIINEAQGLSYYSIQKTLTTTIKRSLFNLSAKEIPLQATIQTDTWKELILQEKKSLGKS